MNQMLNMQDKIRKYDYYYCRIEIININKMENTIEDQKSSNSYASNRGTVSMFKKVKTAKKLSFTPTQASETSELYYDLDEKSIISFDNMVKKNDSIKFEQEIRRSSPEKINNCIDFNDEYNDFIYDEEDELTYGDDDQMIDFMDIFYMSSAVVIILLLLYNDPQ